MSTPSLAAGGIMKFAKVRYSCLGCKATLAPGDTTLCKHCRNKVICQLLDALILLLGPLHYLLRTQIIQLSMAHAGS